MCTSNSSTNGSNLQGQWVVCKSYPTITSEKWSVLVIHEAFSHQISANDPEIPWIIRMWSFIIPLPQNKLLDPPPNCPPLWFLGRFDMVQLDEGIAVTSSPLQKILTIIWKGHKWEYFCAVSLQTEQYWRRGSTKARNFWRHDFCPTKLPPTLLL